MKMSLSRIRIVVISLVALGATGYPGSDPAAAERADSGPVENGAAENGAVDFAGVDFGGAWELDPELSDDPATKIREAMQARLGSRRGFGGGRMPDRRGMQRRLQAMKDRVRSMSITAEEPVLIVVYADGHQRKLHLDGESYRPENGGGDLEIRAQQSGEGDLTIEVTTEEERKVHERWSLTGDGKQLEVTVEIEGDDRRPDITLERVYRRPGTSSESTS
ncbi:MAG: hypothetical protein AAGD01_11995 [Acidobacteriota bacterium]